MRPLRARVYVSHPATLLLWLLCMGIIPAGAQAEEKYGVPALPLHKVHQTIRCAQCHNPSGEVVSSSCLSCHKEILGKQIGQRGLHNSPTVRALPCAKCHKEHKGADAEELLGWKSAAVTEPTTGAFLHQLTGFALTQAKHSDRACVDCHHKKRPSGMATFIDNAAQCQPCHKDLHAPSLGADCLRCHTATAWSPSRMEHSRDTQFPLVGSHLAAAEKGRCQSCHARPPAPTSFKQDSSCGSAACHLRDDKHQGENGIGCGDCHKPTTWKDARSAKEGHNISPQPFGGAHDRVIGGQPCRVCHNRTENGLRGMGNLCITCHQRDDIHHNALGPRCGDCHTQQTFLGARFNHDTVGCTLRGIHRILPCFDCHKGGNYSGLSAMCISCHRDDAMRAAATVRNVPAELHVLQTGCTHCHNTQSFRAGSGTRQSPPESVCQ